MPLGVPARTALGAGPPYAVTSRAPEHVLAADVGHRVHDAKVGPALEQRAHLVAVTWLLGDPPGPAALELGVLAGDEVGVDL